MHSSLSAQPGSNSETSNRISSSESSKGKQSKTQLSVKASIITLRFASVNKKHVGQWLKSHFSWETEKRVFR